MDIARLPKLLNEREAAQALGVSTDTMRRLRTKGKISHTRVGHRVRYTDKHLADYINRETVEACQENEQIDSAKLATIGSQSVETARSGVGPGSIPQLDRSDAHRLAQTIFKRPH